MKKFAVALILLGASASFACPNLAGTYSCPDENGALVTTTMAQSEANGVTTYTLTDDTGMSEFVADGLTRTQAGKVQNGNDAVINVTNSCSADSTALNLDAIYVEKDAAGATVMDMMVKQAVSLDSAGNLMISGTYTENGGTAQPIQGACEKVNVEE